QKIPFFAALDLSEEANREDMGRVCLAVAINSDDGVEDNFAAMASAMKVAFTHGDQPFLEAIRQMTAAALIMQKGRDGDIEAMTTELAELLAELTGGDDPIKPNRVH